MWGCLFLNGQAFERTQDDYTTSPLDERTLGGNHCRSVALCNATHSITLEFFSSPSRIGPKCFYYNAFRQICTLRNEYQPLATRYP